jgi:hypothetical protein
MRPPAPGEARIFDYHRSARVPRAGSGRLWRPVLQEAVRFLARTQDALRYDVVCAEGAGATLFSSVASPLLERYNSHSSRTAHRRGAHSRDFYYDDRSR